MTTGGENGKTGGELEEEVWEAVDWRSEAGWDRTGAEALAVVPSVILPSFDSQSAVRRLKAPIFASNFLVSWSMTSVSCLNASICRGRACLASLSLPIKVSAALSVQL